MDFFFTSKEKEKINDLDVHVREKNNIKGRINKKKRKYQQSENNIDCLKMLIKMIPLPGWTKRKNAICNSGEK